MPEKWLTVVGNIKDNFKVNKEGVYRNDEEGGTSVEFIEFSGPLGLMRLEFVVKPVILDKKTIYSNRIGSETKVDYVYSDTEKSCKLMVYQWDSNKNDWQEMADDSLFNK